MTIIDDICTAVLMCRAWSKRYCLMCVYLELFNIDRRLWRMRCGQMANKICIRWINVKQNEGSSKLVYIVCYIRHQLENNRIYLSVGADAKSRVISYFIRRCITISWCECVYVHCILPCSWGLISCPLFCILLCNAVMTLGDVQVITYLPPTKIWRRVIWRCMKMKICRLSRVGLRISSYFLVDAAIPLEGA